MNSPDVSFDSLPHGLGAALTARGFSALTPIQSAVLDPAYAGRDLRLFSQTGSGKTVAVGLVLAPELGRIAKEREGAAPEKSAKPAAIVIAPTRELAQQLQRELTWLYEPLKAEVAVVTGGTSYPNELRALRKAPLVVVGTPGRLLDHLNRGSIDASATAVVVLDEADQMLDMGFRDDLEAILGKLPDERRTHLVAATFSREVKALADRYQKDFISVEGTAIGKANVDIAHVAHLVRADERTAAIINLLLLAPDERALVFVRTREGAADLADQLADAGFRALSLSGELEQRERTRTVEAFRSGAVTVLVATDVAARGLDIADVNRVIHADPAGDAETFTHRSGRTGRAGRKGQSVVLVPPIARQHVLRLFERARVQVSWVVAPGPDEVAKAADARLLAELDEAASTTAGHRLRDLAAKLLETHEPQALIAALLGRVRHAGPTAARSVTPLLPPPPKDNKRGPAGAGPGRFDRPDRYARNRYDDGPRPGYDNNSNDDRPPMPRGAPVTDRPPPVQTGPREKLTVPKADKKGTSQTFVPFRVTWGSRHGADPRRLLALVCRRGGITSDQIGVISVGDRDSTVEVASKVIADFAVRAREPDERDPRIRIEQMEDGAAVTPPRSAYRAPAPRGGGFKSGPGGGGGYDKPAGGGYKGKPKAGPGAGDDKGAGGFKPPPRKKPAGKPREA